MRLDDNLVIFIIAVDDQTWRLLFGSSGLSDAFMQLAQDRLQG
jgi:hypothetical protein